MKKLTTEEFVKEATQIHNGKYTYEKAVYINRRSPIEITCSTHGSFWQNAGHHGDGHGCPKCKKDHIKKLQTKSYSWFIEKLQKLRSHKNVTLDEDKFKGMTTHAEFECAVHGTFIAAPGRVLTNKKGCPKCGTASVVRSIKTDYSELVAFLTKVHENKYDYSKLQHLQVKKKQTIVCPIHGDFKQSLAAHKRGSGCPSCNAQGGFNPKEPGILYYLSINNGQAYKIGITNRSVEERFNITELKSIKVLSTEYFPNGQDCWDKEKKILSEHKLHKYVGPDLLVSGNTELFTKDVLNLDKEVYY